jgi:hypothetical protein
MSCQRGPVHAELTDAIEAVDHPTALENILFGCFGIDDLRGFAFPLAILLGQVGDGFARVGPCPGRILDARRRVGQDPHLIIGRRDAAAQTDGHKQYRRPHGTLPPCKSSRIAMVRKPRSTYQRANWEARRKARRDN